MHLAELTKLLDDVFLPGQFSDACHNGLVIPGNEQVSRLLVGVSLTRALIERALALKAEALLVHHGVFLSGNWSIPPAISPWVQDLVRHGISLFCFHLPLDAHAEFSHNRYLIDLLDAADVEALSAYGLLADLKTPLTIEQILQRLPTQDWAAALPVRSFELPVGLEWNRGRWLYRNGSDPIGRLAVVSGRGGGEIAAAAAAEAKLLISGEISEYHPEQASILGISLIAIGHNLSERGGLLRLGEWLKKVTPLDISFFFEDNPL